MTPSNTKTKADSNEAVVNMNIAIPADLHRRVRVKCLNEGLQLKQAVEAALREWVKRG